MTNETASDRLASHYVDPTEAFIAANPTKFADAIIIARCILDNIDLETMDDNEATTIIAGHVQIAMDSAVRLAISSDLDSSHWHDLSLPYELSYSAGTKHAAESWGVFAKGFGLRAFPTKEGAIAAAEKYFGKPPIARVTISIFANETRCHIAATKDAIPGEIIARELEAASTPTEGLIQVYRDVFAEITAKAIAQCDDENEPEKITGYWLPVGPLHRAAGKLGFQMFDGEKHLAAAVARIAELERSTDGLREALAEIRQLGENVRSYSLADEMAQVARDALKGLTS